MLPQCYLDPNFFEEELEAVFTPSWVCIGRASQIPRIGDMLDFPLGRRVIRAVRNEEDQIVALSPVCRHRSALVECHTGASGSRLVCPYHKWVYDLDGAFVYAPLMKIGDEDRPSMGLRRFRSAVWLGWIFVNLDGGAPDLADHLAEVEAQLRPWDIARMEPLCDPVIYEAEFNWKIACDNQGESYHLIGSHGSSVFPYVDPTASRFSSDGRSFVRSWFPARDGPMGPAFGSRPPGVRSDFNGTWSYNIFPNHMVVVSDDFVIWQQQLIANEGKYRHLLWVLGRPEVGRDAALAEAISGVRDGLVRVEDEDQASFRQVWEGLSSGDAQPGPFAPSEAGSLYFQRWHIGIMAAARGDNVQWPST